MKKRIKIGKSGLKGGYMNRRTSKIIKGALITILVLIVAVGIIAQVPTYQRQRSVIASGGPNNLTSTSYILAANVVSQTAVSKCSTDAYRLYQGFLVPEGGKVSFSAHLVNPGPGESTYPWSSENKVILHYKFGTWRDTVITSGDPVVVPVDEVPLGEINYRYGKVTTGSNDTLRYAIPDADTSGRAIVGRDVDIGYYKQYKAEITITYVPAPPDTFGAGMVDLIHWLCFGGDSGTAPIYAFRDSTPPGIPEFNNWVDYSATDVVLEFDVGTSGGTVSWQTSGTRSWTGPTGFISTDIKYEKPSNITFRAHKANGGTMDYSVWNSNNKVAVHYLYGGTWHVDYITSEAGITVAVDDVPSGINYWYESVSILNPPETVHRFARTLPDTAGQVNGTATVDLGYYEQYDGQVYITYAPPPTAPAYEETLGAGVARLVHWTYMDVDSAQIATYNYQHNTTFHKWVDKGSLLEFPRLTTPGSWSTINVRSWVVSEQIDAVIKYEKPIPPPALTLYWRRYYLIGLPLYPTEVGDDPAGGHDPEHGYVEGDQDVVLHDDFGGWGYYENRWRVSRYYPNRGAYRYYRGPGRIDRFDPGLGFWIVQNWRDRVDITALGGLVDTTAYFNLPLARYNGNDYSQYNMVANPFMDVPSGDILVYWEDTRVHYYTTGLGEGEVSNPYLARLAGLIEQYIYVYRDGTYLPLEYSNTSPHALREWEGFWAKTLITNAADTVTLKMIPHSGAARKTVAHTTESDEWYVDLKLECDGSIIYDGNNRAGYRPYATTGYDFVGDVDEPADIMYPEENFANLYYMSDGKKLMYDFRHDNFTWDLAVKSRFNSERKMRITWGLYRIPAGMKAYLFDKSANKLIDLQAENEYVFTMGGGERYMTLFVKEEIAGLPIPTPTLPQDMSLNAYPNPFNTTVTIRYTVPKESDVEISIYNLVGEKIKTLVRGKVDAGAYLLTWDGKDEQGNSCGTSLYFIRFRAGSEQKVLRAVLIK